MIYSKLYTSRQQHFYCSKQKQFVKENKKEQKGFRTTSVPKALYNLPYSDSTIMPQIPTPSIQPEFNSMSTRSISVSV